MGRGIFGKKKSSKSLSPATQSPREQVGVLSTGGNVTELNLGDSPLAADPNKPSSEAAQSIGLNKSYSMPTKSTPGKTSRPSSLEHGSGGTGVESGVFTEQLQRLRARLQSVVQGVRDVAQSLDEPHSLIANVRDQLQTRQDAAAARRTSTSLSIDNAAAPAAPSSSLARVSTGTLRRDTPTTDAAARAMESTGTPFAAMAAAANADAPGGGLSVKARVAAVEERSRSGGGMLDPEIRASNGGRAEISEGAVLAVSATAASPEASPRGSLSAARSFGSGRRLGGEAAGESVSGGGAAPEPRFNSRPSSGTWPRVVIPPAVVAPSSYPSTVAAAVAAAPVSARSHPITADDAGSRNVSSAGAVDPAAAAAAAAAAVLAAADVTAADVAEVFGGGDDGLLAAMANPAAAVAYLREHPETLRELWTLRARVRAQEGELTSMVKQLSTKNAQLDQAQISLQVKEKELGAITHRLTGVVSKLQTFQATHSHSQEQQHQQQHQRDSMIRERVSQGGAGSVGAAGDDRAAPQAAEAVTAEAATPQAEAATPQAEAATPQAEAGGDAADPASANSAVLPTSSTPHTPQRMAGGATSSAVQSGASRFAAVNAALQAEQDAMAAAGPAVGPASAPPPSPAMAGRDRACAPRNTEIVLPAPADEASASSASAATSAAPSFGDSTAASADASQSSSPERRQAQTSVRAAGSLDVYIPPPPSVPGSGSYSQVKEQMEEEEPVQAREEEAVASSSFPSAVAAAAAATLGGSSAASRAVAAAAAAAEREGASREVSSLRSTVQEQECQLEAMVRELNAKSSQLDCAEAGLWDKEEQLSAIRAQLDPLMAQLQAAQNHQLQQARPLRGLLRTLLLQLVPSLVCVGLLLRDVGAQRRLQQARRGLVPGAAVAPAATTDSRAPPLQPQSPSQLPRPQRSSPQSPRQLQAQPAQQPLQEPAGRMARLGREVVKAARAAAKAAGVRTVGVRPVKPTPARKMKMEAEAEPAADADDALGSARRECKSHWCEIIRPPPRAAFYY